MNREIGTGNEEAVSRKRNVSSSEKSLASFTGDVHIATP